MRLRRSLKNDANQIVRNLKNGESHVPINDQVTLFIRIGENNQQKLVNDLAKTYIEANPPKNLKIQLYPRIVVDEETKYLLYDIPSFGHDTNMVNEIPRLYFLNKIIKYAKQFKFVFTINWSMIGDEQEVHFNDQVVKALVYFDFMLRIFNNSMAIILMLDETDQGKTNEDIKNSFVNFIRRAKQKLGQKNYGGFHGQKLTAFYDQIANPDFDSIGIYRHVNSAEQLATIQKLISKDIVFNTKEERDFESSIKYILKPDYQNLLKEVSKILTDDIFKVSKAIAEDFMNEYRKKIKQSHDYYQTYHELKELRPFLFDVLNNMFSAFEMTTYTNYLVKLIKKLHPDQSLDNMRNMLRYTQYCDFLIENYRRQELGVDPNEWTKPFNDFEGLLNEWENWYRFLYECDDLMTKYEVQKTPEKYIGGRCQHMANSFGLVCEAAQQKFNLNFEYTFNVPYTKERQEQFDVVINESFSMTKPLVDDSNPNEIIIRGKLVIFSKIPFDRYPNASKFTIFVSKKLIIDRDFKRSGVTIMIFAPKWEIVGDARVFNLDGESAVHWNIKAANGKTPGDNGHDGEPGKPGKDGGNFYGFAKEIIGGEKLTVSTIGGNGGNGMDGGDGADGIDGGKVTKPNPEQCSYTITAGDTEFKKTWCEGCVAGKECYKGEGRQPTTGGKGGQGGKGGAGGRAGAAEIFVMDKEKSGIKFVTSNGENGKGGAGGKGGKGGKGREVKCITCREETYGQYLAIVTHTFIDVVKSITEKDAEAGAPGITPVELNEPDTEKQRRPHVPKELEEYKKYIREGIEDNYFRRGLILKFQDEIHDDPKLQQLYTTIDLVQAFLNLEKQFSSLRKDKELTEKLYQKLISNLLWYAEKLHIKFEQVKPIRSNDPCRDDEVAKICNEKKALTLLYGTLLTKYYNIKNEYHANLVVDMEKYLDIVAMNIEQLKVALKQDIINKSNTEYKTSIDTKINEAQNIISENLLPDIDDVHKDINNQIERLLKETFSLEESTTKKKKDLIKKKAELEEQMKLNVIFGCLKGLSTILSFCGPVGAVAGAVIGLGTQVGENFLIKEDHDFDTLTEGLPGHVSKTLESMNKFYDEKVKEKSKMWNEELDKVIKAAKPSDAQETAVTETFVQKLEKKKKELNDAVKEGDMDKIAKCEGEIQNELKAENIDKLPGQISSKTKANLKKATEYFEKAQKVFEHGVSIYKQYKTDTGKIEKVSKSITECEQNIGKLRDYKKKVNDLLMPMMGKMRNDLKRTAKDLEGASKPTLLYKEWQVQRKLKEIGGFIREFVLQQPKNITDKLNDCVEKIEGTMHAISTIYKQIDDYKEQKQMADYIAVVNVQEPEYYEINDENLRKLMTELKVILSTNYVLQQSLHAGNQFSQLIFPHYSDFFPYVNPNEVIQPERHDIQAMKQYVLTYASTIREIDQHIHIGDFEPGIASSPFYVWRNDQYNDAIRKLLSGEIVTFIADVRHSPPGDNCVKFQISHLDLIPREKSMKAEISNKLDHCQIIMKHCGQNYFKSKHRYFLIQGDSQTFKYFHEKNERGEPKRTNIVYQKYKDGKRGMLSPYGEWEFKLHIVSSKLTYDDLLEYADSVDIALTGKGLSVDDESDVHETINLYYPEIQLVADDEIDFRKQLIVNEEQSLLRRRRSLSNSEYSEHNLTSGNVIDWSTNKLKQIVSSTVNTIQSSYKWITEKPINDSGVSIINSQNTNTNSVGYMSQYDVNGSLLLTNYLIRKLTGEKFVPEVGEQMEFYNNNQAKALDMTTKLENVINEILAKTSNNGTQEMMNFDPVQVQKQILLLLNSGRDGEIDYLVQQIAHDNLPEDRLDEFKNTLYEMAM